MKKFLTVMVVLTTFVMCTSSYGMFLIYKLSVSIKGIDDVTGSPMSIPLKGYLVVNYSFNGSTYDLEDANLIMYGKNVTKNKVYVELDYTGNDLLNIVEWNQGTGYSFINLLSYHDDPFNFEGLMFGKHKATNVGGGITLIDCIISYKGAFWSYSGMFLDPVFDVAGTGTISAKLWTAFTKTVNNDTMGIWYNQDRVLDEIRNTYLMGYTNVTP